MATQRVYVRGGMVSGEVRAEVAGRGSFHFLERKRNSELQKSVMSLVKVSTDVASLT
jgi:hypothetical protein